MRPALLIFKFRKLITERKLRRRLLTSSIKRGKEMYKKKSAERGQLKLFFANKLDLSIFLPLLFLFLVGACSILVFHRNVANK